MVVTDPCASGQDSVCRDQPFRPSRWNPWAKGHRMTHRP